MPPEVLRQVVDRLLAELPAVEVLIQDENRAHAVDHPRNVGDRDDADVREMPAASHGHEPLHVRLDAGGHRNPRVHIGRPGSLKFLGWNVRGILLSGVGVGVVGAVVGLVVTVVGFVVGVSVVGAAFSSCPAHPDARARSTSPPTIDLATIRSPSMRPC